MRTIQIENITLKELEERIQIVMKDSMQNINLQKTSIDEPLTRKETAKLLKVSVVTLNNWAKQKILIPRHIGNRVYYWMEDILKSMKPIYTNNKN